MRGNHFWGELLKKLMAENGLTERGLCRMLGWPRASLRRYLDGTTTMPVDRLEQFLQLCGYELDAIRQEVA